MYFIDLLSFAIFYKLVASAAVSLSPTCPTADGQQYIAQNGQTFLIECGFLSPGGDLPISSKKPQPDFASCIKLCATSSDCLLAAWEPSVKNCKLKGTYRHVEKNDDGWGARLGDPVVAAAHKITLSTPTDRGITSAAPTILPMGFSMVRPSSLTHSKVGLLAKQEPTFAHQNADKRSATGTNSGKRGLAYNLAKYTGQFSQPGHSSKVSWAYNWYSTRYTPWLDGSDTSSFNPHLRYIPMLLSLASDLVGVWDANISPTAGRGNPKTDAILSFNEPDNCIGNSGGTCMSVSTAVSGYRKYVAKFGGKAKLGSPAVTNGPGGLPWLTKFLSECSGCQVDFVVAHFYADASDGVFDYFKSYIQQFHAKTQKPVWVTEFALNNGATDQQRQDFLKAAMKFMDQATYVHRYAYFWDAPGSLVNGDGSLTKLGQIYDHYPKD